MYLPVRRNNHQPITPEMAVTPDQAVEVNPARVMGEFEHFLDVPSMFSVEPLVRKLVSEAYPNHPEASGYFESGGSFKSLRRTEDEVSRFPIFPLSKMQDFEEVLVDMVLNWSYPEGKYSFGPQSELHSLIVRSDSAFAHRALVDHILLPFPRDRRSAFDGPNEMEYKRRLVRDLFSATTYHATPDLNPHATQSLSDIYHAVSPGGKTFESVKAKEDASNNANAWSQRDTLSTDSLRELQDFMLAGFMSYNHPAFDELVLETLRNEPVDDTRLFVILDTLLRGRLRQRDDSYYEDITDMVITQYDAEVADLVKQDLAFRFKRERGESQEARDVNRRLARRIISVELANATPTQTSRHQSSDMLTFGVKMHPLSSQDLHITSGRKSEWVKSSNYYEDLNYLLSLVKGPNLDGVRSRAAWRIAESFEYDFADENKSHRVKAVFMTLADAVLSTTPADYAQKDENHISSVMGAMQNILHRAPKAIDLLSDAEIYRLKAYHEAYTNYVTSVYPEAVDRDATYEERQAYSNVTDLEFSFTRLNEQFSEHTAWTEIRTNHKRYTEFLRNNVVSYAARFANHVKNDGQHVRHEQRGFNTEIGELAARADTMLASSKADHDVDAELVVLVADMFSLYNHYMRSDLRYDNEFYHGHSEVMHTLAANLPLPLKAKALDMIDAGTIYDYISEKDKITLKRELKKAKLR